MLVLVEGIREKIKAHNQLHARLGEAWPNRETRIVAWRPSSREITIHHNGIFWFGSLAPNQVDGIPRYCTGTPMGTIAQAGTYGSRSKSMYRRPQTRGAYQAFSLWTPIQAIRTSCTTAELGADAKESAESRFSLG
jgi:hypothetical protein